jgi:hypothetical protein
MPREHQHQISRGAECSGMSRDCRFHKHRGKSAVGEVQDLYHCSAKCWPTPEGLKTSGNIDVAPLQQLDVIICCVHPREGLAGRPHPRPRLPRARPLPRPRLPLARQPSVALTHTQVFAHAHAQLWHALQPSILILHAFLSALLVTVRRTPVRGPLCGVLPHMVHHLSIAKEVVDHPPSSRRTCRCASIPESRRCCCPTLGPARRILVSSGAQCTSQPSVRKLATLHVAAFASFIPLLSPRVRRIVARPPSRPASPRPARVDLYNGVKADCEQQAAGGHPLTLCML